MRLVRCCMHFFILLSTISTACSASYSSKDDGSEQDKMAMLALRDEFIAGGTPSDQSSSALNSWNTSLHVCSWQGVICGKKHKRVIAIELVGQKLQGTLSTSIGNLTFLRMLNLSSNLLHGKIPSEIGQLRRLQYLSLAQNFFEGRIPVQLSNCSNLQGMSLTRNNLTGNIPFQFSSLSKLIRFYVDWNNLDGEIPSSLFRNLSSLTELALGYNHFHGKIGQHLQGLRELTVLSLEGNNFSDSISPLFNLSSLQVLSMAFNRFTGTLPREMEIAFPKLIFLSLHENKFTGTIPSWLSNISGLTVCQLGYNLFTGRVPYNLGKLKVLNYLHLSVNNLGSTEEINDLSFIDSLTNCTNLIGLILEVNGFSGSLPDSVANLSSKLEVFDIWDNHISGHIPRGIGQLSGLNAIYLGNNLLTGTIPNSIGNLRNLSVLLLNKNKLHGEIPSSIGNLTNLLYLDLSDNFLGGNIPVALGNCRRMLQLDISRNLFQGDIPSDVFAQFQDLTKCGMSYNSFSGTFPSIFENLNVLDVLDVSYNKLSGNIPAQFGASLEFLYMAGNTFEGSLPETLGNSKGLVELDLSHNNLSGPIPKEFAVIGGLEFLNLAFNQLEGEVPWFKNSTEVLITGNDRLCGGNPGLHLRPCFARKTSISRKSIIAITLSLVTCLSVFAVLIFIFLRRHKIRSKNTIDGLPEGRLRVTYSELFKATNGFAEANLIGTGSFGDVYRAVLDGDERKLVAVKVLNLSNHRAAKSFTTECKLLRKIRHRNLLRIETACSSLDHKGNDFKALVFEFMSNGNLDNWLHFSDSQRETRVLTLVQRLKIAIEVGCALDYLHNGCDTPIVHCDLKPSNILLDDDMVAHVADFGLAKLLYGVTEDLSGGESLSTVLRGSIGYVPPEYGMGAAVSPQGDLYSYGIILLELITGKRPTDDKFNDELSLRRFVERVVPENVEEIVDQCLMNELYEATERHRNPEQFKLQCRTFLVSFVEIGISCSAESPKNRMDIQRAIRCLKKIQGHYDSIFT